MEASSFEVAASALAAAHGAERERGRSARRSASAGCTAGAVRQEHATGQGPQPNRSAGAPALCASCPQQSLNLILPSLPAACCAGQTAVHIAARRGSWELVHCLVEAGGGAAVAGAVDCNGRTAAAVARKNGAWAVLAQPSALALPVLKLLSSAVAAAWEPLACVGVTYLDASFWVEPLKRAGNPLKRALGAPCCCAGNTAAWELLHALLPEEAEEVGRGRRGRRARKTVAAGSSGGPLPATAAAQLPGGPASSAQSTGQAAAGPAQPLAADSQPRASAPPPEPPAAGRQWVGRRLGAHKSEASSSNDSS